jgi:hypothetical protein
MPPPQSALVRYRPPGRDVESRPGGRACDPSADTRGGGDRDQPQLPVAQELPAHEEPAHEEPAQDEPAQELPAHEEPAHEEPAHEEPAHEEPAHELPFQRPPFQAVSVASSTDLVAVE